MTHLVPIDHIARMLAERAEAVCAELLPLGRRRGRYWQEASTAAGGLGDSLMVRLDGPKRGKWNHYAGNAHGDLLDLARHVRQADAPAALAWARGFLGLSARDPAALRREAEAARRRAESGAAAAAETQAAETARLRGRAQALWLEGTPIAGTPVEAYLAGRGIRLAELGRVPRALVWHPEVFCAEAGRALPAMLAAVTDGAGQHVNTHRTWLAPVGGRWRKADLEAPKKMMPGAYVGGTIRLSRGAAGTPWAKCAGDEVVALAEGVETALSVAVLVPEWRVAACVALGNLGAVELPPGCRELVVCADRDAPHSPAVAALSRGLRRLIERGYRVRAVRPDPPHEDWNDALVAEQQGPAGGSTSLDVREPAPRHGGTATA